jgi:hypothetical protein
LRSKQTLHDHKRNKGYIRFINGREMKANIDDAKSSHAEHELIVMAWLAAVIGGADVPSKQGASIVFGIQSVYKVFYLVATHGHFC